MTRRVREFPKETWLLGGLWTKKAVSFSLFTEYWTVTSTMPFTGSRGSCGCAIPKIVSSVAILGVV